MSFPEICFPSSATGTTLVAELLDWDKRDRLGLIVNAPYGVNLRTVRSVPHSQSLDAPTRALGQEYFTSPEIHRRDLDRIFRRRWLFAGHASQIPKAGDFFTYELDKDSVLIVRNQDGRINAFHNVCRHRGSRICTERSGNTKAFLCPYHNWVYGLDGRLQTARLMGGDFDRAAHAAIPLWVEEWNGMVFVSFASAQPKSVREFLKNVDYSPFALDHTRVIVDTTYDIQSNWKVTAETFNECYHCAPVHPEFSTMFDPLKDLQAWDDVDAGEDFAIFTPDMTVASTQEEGVRSLTMSGEIACRKPLGLTGKWHPTITGLSWFPQFGVAGYCDHAVTYSWKPLSPTTSQFRLTLIVHRDATEGVDYELPVIQAMHDLLNRQDEEACRVAQLGIASSGYRAGPYHPQLEAPTRGFIRVYLNQVGSS